MKKTRSIAFTAILMAFSLFSSFAQGQVMSPEPQGDLLEKGNVIHGFMVTDVSRYEMINADKIRLVHQKTGAQVLLLLNDDTNRVFDIAFRTRVGNDHGAPHTLEHVVLDGSAKYPGKTVFFDVSGQTYNTDMNANTGTTLTQYYFSTLSEKQLLKTADFYLDSVFHPQVLSDKSIFDNEAWRYALASTDSELSMDGTVYSEMKGGYTINAAAWFNAIKMAFPGNTYTSMAGGIPSEIPKLTWDEIKALHAKCYQPSNSLTCMYGKIEDVPALLGLLDGVFSEYGKQEPEFEEKDYHPLTGPVEKTFGYGVSSDTDTEGMSQAYYIFDVGKATDAQTQVLDNLTTLLSNPASTLVQKAKEKLPSASVFCSLEGPVPNTAVSFSAYGINEEDAQTFKDIVDETLATIASNGIDKNLVDAVGHSERLKQLLVTESSDIGMKTIAPITSYWSLTGDPDKYFQYLDDPKLFDRMEEENSFPKIVQELLIGNKRTAFVVTKPVPGLKEKEEDALKAKLRETKAGMTAGQLDALVAYTKTFSESKACPPEEIAPLKAVTVQSLPEEVRQYPITDRKDASGVRFLEAKTNTKGIGKAELLLDISSLDKQDILWLNLYAKLTDELDSDKHPKTELARLTTRYLFNNTIKFTSFEREDDNRFLRFLNISFTAMDEDLQEAYDLIYEKLFHTDVANESLVRDAISRFQSDMKAKLDGKAYEIALGSAFAQSSKSMAFSFHVDYLDMYAFLTEVQAMMDKDPAHVVAKLQQVRNDLDNRYGAIMCFAGGEEGTKANEKASETFFSKLACHETEYKDFPLPQGTKSEAVILNSPVVYNVLYIPYDMIGYDGYSADLHVMMNLVQNDVLVPKLIFQHGVYSAHATATIDDKHSGIWIDSFRDPNIKETIDVLSSIPDFLATSAISQEELDGNIMNVYSNWAKSKGEMTDGMNAITNIIKGIPQERKLEYMRQLKAMRAQDIPSYATVFRKMVSEGYLRSVGSKSVIQENASLFDAIDNPLSVEDTPKN